MSGLSSDSFAGNEMGLQELIQRFIKHAVTVDIEVKDKTTLDFAAAAYDYYVKCFGAPPDADWPYYVVTDPHFMSGAIPPGKLYAITLKHNHQFPEQRLTYLAQLIYRRVTTPPTRVGRLIGELWVDKMLASRAGYKFMVLSGYGMFMDWWFSCMEKLPDPMSVSALKAVVYKPRAFRFPTADFPAEYHHSINLLAAQVDSIVGWDAMCKLASCRTWKEWFEILPEEQCQRVRELLEL